MKLNVIRNTLAMTTLAVACALNAFAVDLCYYKIGEVYVSSNNVSYVRFSPDGFHKLVLTTGVEIKFNTSGPSYQEHKAQFNKVMNQCRTYNHLKNDGQAPFSG